MSDSNIILTKKTIDLPASTLASQEKILQAIRGFGDEYKSMVFCKYQKPLSIEKSVLEKAPTFHDISNFWGEEATIFWLRFHIAETFAFLGIYDTASKYQVQQTADLIMQHEIYGQLTLSEFLCFLYRFKMGLYGKIYQSNRPNPQEFLACLRPFWNELCEERGKQAEKERQERIAKAVHDPDNMTREEYDEIKTIERMYEMIIPNRN